MSILTLLIMIIVFAVIWYLLEHYVLPRVAEPFKTIIVIVFFVLVIIFLLGLIGIGPGLRL